MELTYRQCHELFMNELSVIKESLELIDDRFSEFDNDFETLLTSQMGFAIFESFIVRLQMTGEAVKSIDKKTKGELLSKYPSVAWRRIMEWRKITTFTKKDHIAYEVVSDALTRDVPPLTKVVEKINREMSDLLDSGLLAALMGGM